MTSPHHESPSPSSSQDLDPSRFEKHLHQLYPRPSRPRQSIRLRYAVISTAGTGFEALCEGLAQAGDLGLPRPWLDPNYLVTFGSRLKRSKLSLPQYLEFIEQRTLSPSGIVGYRFTISQLLYWRERKVDLLKLGFDRVYTVQRRDKALQVQELLRTQAESQTPGELDASASALIADRIRQREQLYDSLFSGAIHERLWLDEPLSEAIKSTLQALSEELRRTCEQQPDPADSVHTEPRSDQHFRVWAFGDAHVGTDIRRGRESLASAIQHSEWGSGQTGQPFRWDIALGLGDMCGAQGLPDDAEGREVVRQFGSMSQHQRTDIYNLCGNHDRSGLHESDAWWFRKWLDPTGENTEHSGVDSSQRPFPVDGTWERYSFRVGNLLFLMMSDINEKSQTKGRGELGGNPAGVVSGETFAWWRQMVESNPDSIIISSHHYVLKNTTVASGEWEGFRKNQHGKWIWHYHGYKPEGAPRGASYLYFVDGVEDAQCFERYLEEHPSASALWLGGHTHAHPDDTHGDKSHIETRWGCHFVNVSALTRYHGKTCVPMSRRFSFTEGSDEVTIECYLHSDKFKQPGWYPEKSQTLKLPRPFVRSPSP